MLAPHAGWTGTRKEAAERVMLDPRAGRKGRASNSTRARVLGSSARRPDGEMGNAQRSDAARPLRAGRTTPHAHGLRLAPAALDSRTTGSGVRRLVYARPSMTYLAASFRSRGLT